MRKANQSKHVFCLEGILEKGRGNAPSVRPILDLVHHLSEARLKYMYRECATPEELEDQLLRWANGFKEYPVLYLSFTMSSRHIQLEKEEYPLNRLSQLLKNTGKKRIIIFGAHTAWDMDRQYLADFLAETGCLAVCGYRADISWINPTSFELLMMNAIQDNEFSEQRMAAMAKELKEVAINFKELDFRIVTAND